MKAGTGKKLAIVIGGTIHLKRLNKLHMWLINQTIKNEKYRRELLSNKTVY